MSESTLSSRLCGHASLAALGHYLRQIDLLAPIRENVQIGQKTVKYTPFDKLCDAFALLLTGAHRMVEINTRLRADPALCQAFGRSGCAEQSVVQDTLDACTDANVHQMQQAVNAIFRTHRRACRHDYQKQWQLLDLDLSGRVCGKSAEDAAKGYFADQPGAYGRQEGRVYASWYDETVCVRLFMGNTTTAAAVQPLLADAQATLLLSASQREHTIVRLDAGGGSVDAVNTCLSAGYQFIGKDFSTVRAKHLAESVAVWYDDPKQAGRQVGLVTSEPTDYVRPVVRIAVRCARKKGPEYVCVLISTLSAPQILALAGPPDAQSADMQAVLPAYVHFYDARGGGVETGFKQDQQGLGRRNKKCFAAQAMLLWLECLAHNVLIWARSWLSPAAPAIAGYGLLRRVRDALSIPGRLCLDAQGGLRTLVLSRAHPLAAKMQQALQQLLAQQQTYVCLGEI
jgi:Transposase DDE domain group 1